MPNFDGGHYFLTALIPISTGTLVEKDGQRFAPIQSVRKALATLPTALQTPASQATRLNSPFSRNTSTHFARFVVVEDVMYNGRDPENAIKASIDGTNPVLSQPQDLLSFPYLLFVADFDAKSGEIGELTAYLEELWGTMKEELCDVFGHCVGFEKVKDGAGFAAYVEKGQIETTMSFNDYWTISPPLKSLESKLIAVLVVSTVAGILAGILIGAFGGGWVGALLGLVIGAVIGLVVAVIIAYRLVMKTGAQPFPTAPDTELPSILKGLYLQQNFTKFAIKLQTASAPVLYDEFAAFLHTHQPNASMPTQPPGVIK
jgi:hypothetical protein